MAAKAPARHSEPGASASGYIVISGIWLLKSPAARDSAPQDWVRRSYSAPGMPGPYNGTSMTSKMQISATSQKRADILIALFVVLFVLWQYWGTLSNAALFGDDYMNIFRSARLSWQTHLKGFLAPNNDYNSRPLGNLLLILIYRCFGVAPLPFLGLLFGLHLATTFLGFFVALRLLQNKYLAALATLAWSFNCLTTANILASNVIFDNLLAFFWTASLLLYLQDRENSSRLKYIGALICFFLCTRSKEVGVMLALALLAFEAVTWDGKGLIREKARITGFMRVIKRQWPFYAISLIYLIFFLRKSEFSPNPSPDHPYYMKLTWDTFVEGMKYYLARVTFERELIRSSMALYLAFAVATLWAALLRQRILWLTLFTFLITLLPVIFFINHREPIYLYLPLFSLSITVVGLLGYTLLKVVRPWKSVGYAIAYVVMTLIFLQYSSMNRVRIGYVKDASRRASINVNQIVTHLKQWYPRVPANARFYFFGLPAGQPNPDLLILYMPRLLYGEEAIESSMVSETGEVLKKEASQPDNSFYCFDFANSRVEGGENYIIDRTSELRGSKSLEK